MEKIKYICGKCGSEDIRIGASAKWNAGTQKWELAEIHSCYDCRTCDAEDNIRTVPAG